MNFDDQMRSFALSPDEYHWALKAGGNASKEKDWEFIWPWEKSLFEEQGRQVAIGATLWKK